MKIVFRILFVSLLFVGCQQKINRTELTNINGYWEIEKVVFEKGEDKNYGINESYDYFQIGKNNGGTRKKVMPQLDGTFLVNDDYENVKIRFADDKVYLDYSTPFTQWSEELLAISKDKMVLKNKEEKEYHYKKTGPINLLGDGKKAK